MQTEQALWIFYSEIFGIFTVEIIRGCSRYSVESGIGVKVFKIARLSVLVINQLQMEITDRYVIVQFL